MFSDGMVARPMTIGAIAWSVHVESCLQQHDSLLWLEPVLCVLVTALWILSGHARLMRRALGCTHDCRSIVWQAGLHRPTRALCIVLHEGPRASPLLELPESL